MIVDDDLIDTAIATLERCFGTKVGAATAVYTLEGDCYTSVALRTVSPSSSIPPESGALCDALKHRQRVSALVTVAHLVEGGPLVYVTPSGLVLDQLSHVSCRECQVVVHDLIDPTNYFVRTIQALLPNQYSEVVLDGRYDTGMGALARPLRQLSREQGVPSASSEFAPCLVEAFGHPLVRRSATPRGKPGAPGDYVHPCQLPSIALRHVWFAFEAASHALVEAVVDAHAPTLVSKLGFTTSDLFRLKQGGEAMRFVFASMLVWVGTGRPVMNEAPFRPYHSALLRDGRPMHEALPLVDGADDGHLVSEVVRLLGGGGTEHLAAYLRERRLFSQHLFAEGSGRCPFDETALAVYRAAADGIETAWNSGVILRS